MAFHIRDPKTDAVVRKLAKRKGVGITEAVLAAAEHELEREEKKLSLWERTADIRAEIASWPRTGLKADKAFFDEMWGQGDDD
jgi:antitoxin VapB